MVAVYLLIIFTLLFLLAFLVSTLLTILRRNLIIPLTTIYLLFFFLGLKNLVTPEDIVPKSFSIQVRAALGLDIIQMIYWFILYLLYLFLIGLIFLLFEVFLKDKARRLLTSMEHYFSISGLINILTIASLLIVFAIFAGFIFNFATATMAFLCMICLTASLLEIINCSGL